MLSYELNHSDGRKSYPLVLLNWAPSNSETSLLTLHASALMDFQTIVRSFFRHCATLDNLARQADVSKVIEVRDGPESLTKEYVDQKLAVKL